MVKRNGGQITVMESAPGKALFQMLPLNLTMTRTDPFSSLSFRLFLSLIIRIISLCTCGLALAAQASAFVSWVDLYHSVC